MAVELVLVTGLDIRRDERQAVGDEPCDMAVVVVMVADSVPYARALLVFKATTPFTTSSV